MKCKYILLWFFSIVSAVETLAQVQFYSLPKSLALFPRDLKTNTAVCRFKGDVFGKYSNFSITTTRNGKKFATYSSALNFSSGSAPFDYSLQIPAGKYRYNFTVKFTGTDSLIVNIKDVLAGDVYIVQGQSNAVANSYSGLVSPGYTDSFMRSFGSSTYDAGQCSADTVWHYIDGDGYYGPGCIGQWATVIGKYLIDSFGIPMAILNGAVGGTLVSQHQRYNPQPDNLYTIYGRLLYRMRTAHLENNVRGILYFQGESDGQQGRVHDSLFRILYADWQKDYKGLRQNYLVQVRGGGCGSPTAEMLDYQRLFEFTLNKLKVISSNGLNGHDGCHYALKNGYELLGKCLAPLMARDLYGSGRKTNIDPPNIESVFYNNATHTELILNMRQASDSIFTDAGFEQLFSLTGDPSVSIIGGAVVKNHVILKLNAGTCKDLYLTYMGKAGYQPWVKNRLGAGLIGFNLIKVQKPVIKPVYSGCINDPLVLGEDSIPGYKYKWIRINSGAVKTTAKISLVLKADEKFTAIMTYKNLACIADTFSVLAVVEKLPKPNLGNDTVLCNNAKWEYTLPAIYKNINWIQNTINSTGQFFGTNKAGSIRVEATSTFGCKYRDTVEIITANPTVKITGPKNICPSTDTIYNAKNGFTRYVWNGFNSNLNTFRFAAGQLKLLVTDTLGCEAKDTFYSSNFVVETAPKWQFTICPYDSVFIAKPTAYIHWRVNTQVLPNAFYVKNTGLQNIVLTDSNYCIAKDSVQIINKQMPYFSLGKDTALCDGNKLLLHCNYNTLNYEWNGQRKAADYYIVENKGLYTCKITAPSGCIFADSILINYFPNPKINLPLDTTLCTGTDFIPFTTDGNLHYLNNNLVQNPKIKSPGNYAIALQNKYGCTTSQWVKINFILCVNGLAYLDELNSKLYPNPAHNEITLQFYGSAIASVQVMNSLGNCVLQKQIISGEKLNITELKPGIYLLVINNKVLRFIKD